MTRTEQQQLMAEQAELKRLLAQIPAEDAIDRLGLESRLEEVVATLGQNSQLAPEPARAQLTFRGKPVVGNQGIFLEFGTTAMGSFANVVATIAACLRTGPVKWVGPIPDRDQHQLLITSFIPGSFGFELEEHREGLDLEGEESATAQALGITQTILEATRATDDELADVLSSSDTRALNAIRSFLKVMVDADACCAMHYREHTMRFSDPGEVKRSLERLGEQNIKEEATSLEGIFIGVLPQHRTFEFRKVTLDVSDYTVKAIVYSDHLKDHVKVVGGWKNVTGGKVAAPITEGQLYKILHENVITGKVGAPITDAGKLNDLLGKGVVITVIKTQVGHGKPCYTLSEWPKLGKS